MKNRRERAKEVRRRKVASLAAYSRKFTVKHGVISTVKNLKMIPWDCISDKLTRFNVGPKVAGTYYLEDEKGNISYPDHSWKIPNEGFKQPKRLRKKYKKKYYNHDGSIRKIVTHPSDFEQFKNWPYTLPKMNRTEYMEHLAQYKLAKWERKNPCPVKKDDTFPDLFEQEFVVPWKQERDLMLERFRDFVVSIYDKLPLTGRFKKSENDFSEELVTEIKDINGDGHKINEVTEKSPLIKKAQKITNQVHAKRSGLICTNLKDHKRRKGRLLLPQAA